MLIEFKAYHRVNRDEMYTAIMGLKLSKKMTPKKMQNKVLWEGHKSKAFIVETGLERGEGTI